MLTLRYNEPVFILMLRGRVGCLRQPPLPMLESVADIAHVIVVNVYDRSKNCIMGKIIRLFARRSNIKGTRNMQEF